MLDRYESSLHFLRLLLVGTVCVVGLLLLVYLFMDAKVYGLTGTSDHKKSPLSGSSQKSEWYDGSNPITRSTARMADDFKRSTASTGKNLAGGGQAVVSATVQSGKFAASTVHSGLSLAGQGIVDSITITSNSVGNFLDNVSSSPVVSAIITPSVDTEVPVIDPNTAAWFQNHSTTEALHEAVETPTPDTTEASWPIHGRITTLFGVPHWPYQPTHTGLDISSGNGSGIMSIKPFRPGRVIDTIYSKYGLGNHVIIDHGEGITSVYAHLALISVSVGQDVDKSSVIGYEGTTGASTGTHLHFEIRLNGQPTDPQKYISGRP